MKIKNIVATAASFCLMAKAGLAKSAFKTFNSGLEDATSDVQETALYIVGGIIVLCGIACCFPASREVVKKQGVWIVLGCALIATGPALAETLSGFFQ